MPTIEYIRRFPREAYGYEEFKTVCESVEELATVVLEFETWRMERPVNPDDIPFNDEEGIPFDEPPHPAETVGRQTRQTQPRRQQNTRGQTKNAVLCGFCHGPTWDNREGKRTGKTSERAPDFKCKDKDNCGGAMWLTDDGEHGEWKE